MTHKRISTMMKAFAFVLIVMLAVTFMPPSAFAGNNSNTIKVYMTVSVKGKIAKAKNGEPMTWKAVRVADLDKNNVFTYDEALIAAHAAYNDASGYVSSRGVVTKLWGKNTDNPLLFIGTRGIRGDVNGDTVQEGDHLTASIVSDRELYTDWFTTFADGKNKAVTKTSAKVNEPVEINVLGHPGMTITPEDKELVPLQNFKITKVGSKKVLAETDEEGKAQLTFSKAGTYMITGEGPVPTPVSKWGMRMAGDGDDVGLPAGTYYVCDNSYESMIGVPYTKKNYGDGPVPYDKVIWIDWTDWYEAGSSFDGFLLRTDQLIKECPTIAPCYIVNVKAADIKDATVTVAPAAYTGDALTPDVTVELNGKTLEKDTDYTAEFTDNTEIGSTAKVTITGKDNYVGTIEKEFTIDQADIKDASVTIDPAVYTGEALTPDVTLELNGKTLEKDTDYTVEYSNNTEVGSSAIAEITGTGNYTGTVKAEFAIDPIDMKDASVTIDPAVYTGDALTPYVTVELDGIALDPATDYTVEYSNNINAGTSALATITGTGNYGGAIEAEFTIDPADIAEASVSFSSVDDPEEELPAVTVELNGVILEQDTDYTLVYDNSLVTITGIGNYTGTIEE